MCAIFDVLLIALRLYFWVIIAAVVFSWLLAFSVVNTGNRFVALVGDALYRLTEPALRPIRQFMPNLGGIDISPIFLILGLFLIQSFIHRYSGCYL
jgi:YggT family protein